MKKISKLLLVFVLICSVALAGGKAQKEAGAFVPGTYRAASSGMHNSGAFAYVTFVTMIVGEEGMIDNVIIDTTFPIDRKDLTKGFSTKQAMGDDYGMRIASEIEKEWNEQADALGANIVANQGITFEVKEDKTTDGVAGATIKISSYVALIEEVLEQAKK